MEERFNDHERGVIVAVGKACALSPSGWADAWDISKFSHPNWRRPNGALVAPTLTLLRGWKKPLVESRDGDGRKEYRLTPAGKRARKDSRVSAVPD